MNNFSGDNLRELAIKILQAFVLLFIFLVAINGLGTGFKGLGKDVLDTFFVATDNPFIALMVGILATTLVQSSSVTTATIVALVAVPDNPLPMANAIPMIMGANIGTTVTNSLVSLAHLHKDEFNRAFSAATCHDFFNLLAVAMLLPLELATGFLSKISGFLASFVKCGIGGRLPNPIKAAAKEGLAPIQWAVNSITTDKTLSSIILIAVSAAIIFVSLTLIVRVFKTLTTTKLKDYVSNSLDNKPFRAIAIGVMATCMVQSSSVTTSILIPLAAAGIITLPNTFNITLGANVGTTITALVASMAAPEATIHLAVQIALVHLLFNLVGIGMVYPIRKIREIPMKLAKGLADVAAKSKKIAIAYVVAAFYGIPALLVFVSKLV